MNTLTGKELKSLLALIGKPCVSLYQPTRPGGAEQDPIQFKNLIVEAEEIALEKGMTGDAVKKMFRPARRLLSDAEFWRNAGEGLAVFMTPTQMRWYRLRKPVAPRVVVGERFFVKPLLSLLDREARFYVLGLNPKRIHLWEGDAEGVHEIELHAMPTSLAEALQLHDRDEPLEFHSHKVGGHWDTVFHGQGVGIDTAKDDLFLYFQKIDRGLHEYLPARAPLILAGVEYLWPIYRKANRHPHLVEEGIPGNAERWSMRDLHEHGWNLVRERFEQPVRAVRGQYAALAGTGRTCHDPVETVQAACAGRLEALMIAGDRETWGGWDPAKNEVVVHPQAMNGDEDLANLAAIHAAEHGAKVFVLPTRDMPEQAGIAGIYWLPHVKHG
ncbi:MAG: hypothetical protein HYR84_16855 [Planctomycetes bacterium]|nr:hypothetical protein [Planctomycetota bacterium]